MKIQEAIDYLKSLKQPADGLIVDIHAGSACTRIPVYGDNTRSPGEALKAENMRLNADMEYFRLQTENHRLKAENEGLQTDLARRGSNIHHLEFVIKGSRAKQDELKAENEGLKADKERLMLDVSGRDDLLKALSKECGSLKTEIEGWKEALADRNGLSRALCNAASQYSALAAENERLKAERNGWEKTAAEIHESRDYYRGLLVQIGETIGDAAYVADDHSRSQDVLCAKLPELVAWIVGEYRSMVRATLRPSPVPGASPDTGYVGTPTVDLGGSSPEAIIEKLRPLVNGLNMLTSNTCGYSVVHQHDPERSITTVTVTKEYP